MLPILNPLHMQSQLTELGYAAVYENESAWILNKDVVDYKVISYKTALKLLRLNVGSVWKDSSLQKYRAICK